jgi:hypothetical protein
MEDFVERVHKRVSAYAEENGLKEAAVQVELADGSIFWVHRISPEPGYGFITIRPHPEDDEPEEDVIIPVGSIKRITVAAAEERRAKFGFAVPEAG